MVPTVTWFVVRSGSTSLDIIVIQVLCCQSTATPVNTVIIWVSDTDYMSDRGKKGGMSEVVDPFISICIYLRVAT